MALSVGSLIRYPKLQSGLRYSGAIKPRVLTVRCCEISDEPPRPKSKLQFGSPIIIVEAPKVIKTAASMPCLRANSGLVKPGDVGSDEAKEKIRASVKQVWAERVRSRLLEEKFMSLWSENIVEAARKGGYGEVKLYWNSYETIKQEFSYEQLQLSEEKVRAKQETKMIAKQDA